MEAVRCTTGLLIIIAAIIIKGVESGLLTTIESDPNGPVQPGDPVTFTCHVKIARFESLTIVWVKKIGRMYYDLAQNARVEKAYRARYTPSGVQFKGAKLGMQSTLTIEGVMAEDIGMIGCAVYNSGEQPAYTTLAVCDSLDSSMCTCITKTGWLSPECWKDPPTLAEAQGRFDQIVIGLVVCLVIAILFGVVMTVIVAKDVASRMRAKREGNRQLVEAPVHQVPQDPYAFSEEVSVDPEELGLSFVEGSAVNVGTRNDPERHSYRHSKIQKSNNTTPNNRGQPGPTPAAAAAPSHTYDNLGASFTPEKNYSEPRTPQGKNTYHQPSTPRTPNNYDQEVPHTPRTPHTPNNHNQEYSNSPRTPYGQTPNHYNQEMSRSPRTPRTPQSIGRPTYDSPLPSNDGPYTDNGGSGWRSPNSRPNVVTRLDSDDVDDVDLGRGGIYISDTREL